MAEPEEKEVDDLHAELSANYDDIDAKDAGLEPPERQQNEVSDNSVNSVNSDNWVRDEHGRFARRTDAPVSSGVAGQVEAQGVLAPQPQQPVASPAPIGPPSSWSIQAKAEFGKLPAPVVEAIAKREAEVSHGFQQYQERYKALDPFIEMARQANVVPAEAIQAWMNAEQLLNRDFEQGMRSLCQYYNVDPRALAARWMANRNGTQQPQFQNGQGGQMPSQWQQEIYALKSEIDAFKKDQEQQQFYGIKSEVDTFGSKPEHKYFENVRQIMAGLIKTGVADDLQDAYDKACWSHPEIRQLQINEQLEAKTSANRSRASDARRAAGSLNPGSPLPGATSSGRGSPKATLRDQLLEDWDALSA